MSQPPGTPGSPGEEEEPPFDPWAPPPGASTPPPSDPPPPLQPPYGQPGYGPPQYGQPAYGQPAYGQPPYGQPAYGQPMYGAPQPPTNGKAQGAMWTGIASLVLTFCCAFPGLAGAVAIVLGVRARREIRQSGGQQSGDGMALAGIITGAIAFVLALIALAVVVIAVATGSDSFHVDSTSA
jgi:hypothetical protein